MKSALGLVSILYCGVLAGQHYFMYRDNPNKLGRLEAGELAGGADSSHMPPTQLTCPSILGELPVYSICNLHSHCPASCAHHTHCCAYKLPVSFLSLGMHFLESTVM